MEKSNENNELDIELGGNKESSMLTKIIVVILIAVVVGAIMLGMFLYLNK